MAAWRRRRKPQRSASEDSAGAPAALHTGLPDGESAVRSGATGDAPPAFTYRQYGHGFTVTGALQPGGKLSQNAGGQLASAQRLADWQAKVAQHAQMYGASTTMIMGGTPWMGNPYADPTFAPQFTLTAETANCLAAIVNAWLISQGLDPLPTKQHGFHAVISAIRSSPEVRAAIMAAHIIVQSKGDT